MGFSVNIGILLIGILILLLVPLIRSEPLIGNDAFFFLRLAKDPGLYDSLSYGGRVATYNWGLPLLLRINQDILPKALPFILGALSLVLFMCLLRKFNVKDSALGVLFLAASPPFIYLFTSLNNYFCAVFLSLLGFYLFSSKYEVLQWFGLVSFVLLPIFNFPITLITLALLALYIIFHEKEKRKLGFITLAITSLITIIYYGYFLYNAGMPQSLIFSPFGSGFNYKLQTLMSDLGGKFGFGIFSVILAVCGMMALWRYKYRRLFVFFSITLLFVLTLIWPVTIFIFNFYVAILAAYGTVYLLTKGWQSNTIKQFTVIIIICGLLFSAVSHINCMVKSEPDVQVIKAVTFLKKLDPGVVFSDYNNGFLMNYAQKSNMMDINFLFAPKVNERWVDYQQLISTRDLKVAKGIIKKYNLKYIWVDKSMRDKLWTYDEDGLLFLLKYNPDFVMVYSRGGINIWRIKQ